MEFCEYCGYRTDLCRCSTGNNKPDFPDFPPDNDKPEHGKDHHPPHPTLPPPPPIRKKEIVHDEVCGNIEQTCGDEAETYWEALSISDLPSGTISVVNKGFCDITVSAAITADGEFVDIFTVSRGQTKSATLGNIAGIAFACAGDEGLPCRGTYCLSLHYEKDC